MFRLNGRELRRVQVRTAERDAMLESSMSSRSSGSLVSLETSSDAIDTSA